MDSIGIVWFRQDLRISDNPALATAIKECSSIVPVYIHDCAPEEKWSPGGATRWWLHQSLKNLDQELRKLGSRLIICEGESATIMNQLVDTTNSTSVYWNRLYDPRGRKLDKTVTDVMRSRGVSVETFNATLLHEPNMVRTREGSPYKVFTPFWNQFPLQTAPALIKAPGQIPFPHIEIESLPLNALELEPKPDWAGGLRATWTPGEQGARSRLRDFLREPLWSYSKGRDRPDQNGVSMLSPHLHFGEISPTQILRAIQKAAEGRAERQDMLTYMKELGWREFAYHILVNFPHTAEQPLRDQFKDFPWLMNDRAFAKWTKGETGYPIIDAGMRQLWHTGWMHNRVRMVVASFLTKDLLISWIKGAEWFWDTLVDADLASNTLGWQWASGCGADAAPYFRIFNPVLQGEKFDPEGDYVRKWVPELAKLSKDWIHKPWCAPDLMLAAAGVQLGRSYPQPVIDHGWARKRALEALAQTK